MSLSFLVSCVLSVAVKSRPIHSCIHDSLPTSHIYRSPVPYFRHTPRRRLSGSEEWEPIRITPYWSFLKTDLSANASLLLWAQQLVSAGARYLQRHVRVRRVSGSLRLHRPCEMFFMDSQGEPLSCVNFTADAARCFTVEIPEEHLADDYALDGIGRYQYTLRGGQGVPDTDLVIYVTAQDVSCGAAVAWASACLRDQYGRPIAGVVNLCPNTLTSVDWQVGVDVVLHELTHILIMSSASWSEFRFENNTRRSVDSVLGVNGSHYHIKTPQVLAATRDHFGCESALGAALEDSGSNASVGSHWDERHFFSEIMGAVSYGDVVHFSRFTWALMQDSGWYRVDVRNASEPFRMGYRQGCTFLRDDCIDGGNAVWPQYFCSETRRGCTFDGLGVASCYITEHASVPADNRWFDDQTTGGSEYADYCPFMQAFDDEVGGVVSPMLCTDANQSSLASGVPTSAGELHSRCLEGTLESSQTEGFCFEVSCEDFNATSGEWSALRIAVGSANVTCLRNDTFAAKEVSGFSGTLTCPELSNYCVGPQPFACLHGHWSVTEGRCQCRAGFSGAICDEPDAAVLSGNATLRGWRVPDLPCRLRVANASNYNGVFALQNDLFEGSYRWQGQDDVSGLHLFYSVLHRAFFVSQTNNSDITRVYEESVLFCNCRDCIDTLDPRDCNGMWYLLAGNSGVGQQDFSIEECSQTSCAAGYGACVELTAQPTQAPLSVEPTVAPTRGGMRTRAPTPASAPSLHSTACWICLLFAMFV